mmetsp:Transcript_15883/g.26450  ORF Transcript_15883/g.26450 Transcript_15883/m.26450 type:complete len:108 (-) Transcript_15883:36-359(-)
MGHHPAAKYKATLLPDRVSGSESEDTGDADPSEERRGGRDEMAAVAAAAHADVLDDAKSRDETRWQRAMAGEEVPLRDATNIRPRGTKRDGTTMAEAIESSHCVTAG